jgi:hypothetical protein
MVTYISSSKGTYPLTHKPNHTPDLCRPSDNIATYTYLYLSSTNAIQTFYFTFLCALFSDQVYLQLKQCLRLLFLTAKNVHFFATLTTLTSNFQARHVYHDSTIIKIHGLRSNFGLEVLKREHGSYPNQRYRVLWFNLWEKRDSDHGSEHGYRH